MKEGYCVTSRKFKHVSRLDRPDWKEHMAIRHSPWSMKEGLSWVKCLGERGAEDHYRRVYSKDRKVVKSIRSYAKSHETITGFIPKEIANTLE
jgi:hypothetical protein